MPGSFTAVMDGQTVIDLLTDIAEGLEAAELAEVATGSQIIVEVMKANAPVGVGGDKGLRGSIGFELDPVLMQSEIKPTVPYGDAVETGSRPHWPPAGPDSALAAWAKLKGLNVWALAASIAKKGTKAHPYIAETYDEVEVPVLDSFSQGITSFLEGLQA